MNRRHCESSKFSQRLRNACVHDKSYANRGLNVNHMRKYYSKTYEQQLPKGMSRAEIRKLLSARLYETKQEKRAPSLFIRGLQFEGGDILLDGEYIYIGTCHAKAEHGCATNTSAVRGIQKVFEDKKVIGVELARGVLHLDLVFNILPFEEKSCIVYPGGVRNWKTFKKVLEQNFRKIYRATESQYRQYACNYMNTGPNKMIVSKSREMQRLVAEWKRDNPNLQVEFVDFEYIYGYLGGSIRCSSFPVRRTVNNELAPSFSVRNETDPLRVCVVGKLTKDKESEVCRNAYRDIGELLETDKTTRRRFLQRLGKGLDDLAAAMRRHGVEVLRPDERALANVPACNVIFCRDVATVIGPYVLVGNMHLEHRKGELDPTLQSVKDYFQTLPKRPPY